MSKRTQLSQTPTNNTQKQTQTSASSCIINKKRQMFQSIPLPNLSSVNPKHIVQQNDTKLIPKNVLIMNPNHINSINWPEVFMPDQELSVSLKGNFYSIKDSRNKQKFVNRKSMPNSQIMHFNAQKNGDKLILTSVQKFINKTDNKTCQLWYHFNVAIINIETQTIENFSSIEKGFVEVSSAKTATNLSAKIGQFYYLQFKGMQLIDNNKKAFVVFQPVGLQRNRYEVIMIDFYKSKSPQVPNSSKQLSESRKFAGYSFNIKKVGCINFQRKESQIFKKLINSEYGDIVLLITSHEIYEIQIAGQLRHNQYTLILKPFLICKIFSQNKNTYVSNQTNQLVLSKQIFSKEQKIIDAEYVMSGLKIMILTSHGRIFVVQSEQCIFSQSLYQMLSNKQMVQNYNIQYFVFKTIYFLRGLLVVEVEAEKKQDCNLLRQIKHEQSILQKLDQKKNMFEYVSRGLIIAKVQSNSLSFSKFISLPFHLKDFQYLKVRPFKQADELLIQVISLKNPQTLELHRCQIISNKNSFIPFKLEHFIREPKIAVNTVSNSNQIIRQTDTKGSSRVTFGKSHKSFYILKGNQISGYRIYTNQFVSVLQNGIQKTLSVSFFEKPIKIITNPLTGQVVILYREFIKFFMSIFTELKLLFVMNIRDVKDICFSRSGESLLICLSDNSIYLVDSYRLNERKIMDFYGDVKQIHHGSDYILTVRTCKNILNIFRKKQTPAIFYNMKSNSQALEYYDKLYDLKIDSDDLYHTDQHYTVVLKKDGSLEFYSHIQEMKNIKSTEQKDLIRLNILQKEHPHLINKKKLMLQKLEYPTYLFFSSQFSTLFIGTNFGNIRQYLYPFLSIQDPSPPECYTFSVANNSITHIEINADFSSLYAVTDVGQVLQLQFDQFLNGLKKNGIYVLSKTQNFEHQIKYEFANRNYLIDDFTTINDELKRTINENYEETCFVDDKIKNDIEDITNKIKVESHKTINKLTSDKKNIEETFKQQFCKLSIQMKSQQKSVQAKLDQLHESHQKIKQEMIDKHEKELLQIYQQNDRLKNIKQSKQSEFTKQSTELRQQLGNDLNEQIGIKQIETAKLQQQYRQLYEKYDIYSKVADDEKQKTKGQLQKYKMIFSMRYEDKLIAEQNKKQSQLSRMGKIQKQIQRYKKRSIYFENLIVQTRNQIQQLNNDVSLYSQKKQQLIKQLQNKQLTIQDKQTQIVKYLKTTNQMKKIKNIHQFQLTQCQQEINPIYKKIQSLEKQVQKMNQQIMNQFNSKIQHDLIIQSSHKRIQKLKNKFNLSKNNIINSNTKLLRFNQQLSAILNADPFANNIKSKLSKVIDKFSNNNEVFVPNEQLQRGKKQSMVLIRKKNMMARAIQRQQKLQQGIIKNKNQFFRFYSDNTNLVKQYNQLFQDHNLLIQQKTILQQKIKQFSLRQQNKTPLKRTSSLHIRKISQKKLTPFQRYQQQQMQFNTIKLKQSDTTQTKLSRGESTSFLKSLIKDVSSIDSHYDKSNIIRQRIRTFVNPQMQRKNIQKQLFNKQRQRGKSNHIPLLRL